MALFVRNGSHLRIGDKSCPCANKNRPGGGEAQTRRLSTHCGHLRRLEADQAQRRRFAASAERLVRSQAVS